MAGTASRTSSSLATVTAYLPVGPGPEAASARPTGRARRARPALGPDAATATWCDGAEPGASEDNRGMNVAVCVKQIPDPASPRKLDPNTHTLVRDGKLILDDSDAYGVEMALQLVGQGRWGRGHARVHGPEQRDQRPAHGPGHGCPQGHPRQRRRAEGLRRPGHGQGPGRRHQAGRARPGASPPPSPPTATPAPCRSRSPSCSGCPSITFAKKVEVGDGKVQVDRQTEAGYDEVECALPAVDHGHGGCGRAPLPVLQGHHGGQGQAGRPADGRRPRRRGRPGRARRSAPGGRLGRAGRGSARRARSWSTRATGTSGSSPSSSSSRSSRNPGKRTHDMAVDKIWVVAESSEGKVAPGRRSSC